jgi:uncharacterized SAM-binding protein YcdF (DUF218 family)
MSHILQRLLSELILPPLGTFLLLLFGLLLSLRYRRSGLAVAALATVLQFAFSLAGLGNLLHGPWPEVPAVVGPPYPPAEAIIVLGGGRYLDAPEYGGDTAGPSTLERVRYAARLHRETAQPVLVSGGRPGGIGSRSEAAIMRDLLEQEFRVPVRWVEDSSEETAQNAAYSARILLAAGVSRAYLVTHGAHMERAAAAFDGTGIEVVPMITGFVRPDPDSVFAWMPSFYGIAVNREWLYERLARLRHW